MSNLNTTNSLKNPFHELQSSIKCLKKMLVSSPLSFHKKRKGAKFQFDITIHYISRFPKNNAVLWINWVRGRKFNGEIKKSLIKDNTAVWVNFNLII